MDKILKSIAFGEWLTPESHKKRAKQAVPEGRTFHEIIQDYLEKEGLTNDNLELSCITELSESTCSRLRTEENYNPSIKTILAFGIGLGIPVEEIKYLLSLKKHALSLEDSVHYAYIDVLNLYGMFGLSVEQCNKILTTWGVKEKDLLKSIEGKTKSEKCMSR